MQHETRPRRASTSATSRVLPIPASPESSDDRGRIGQRVAQRLQRRVATDEGPADLHRCDYLQPRPMKGIFVAITVMNCTLASSGSDAM